MHINCYLHRSIAVRNSFTFLRHLLDWRTLRASFTDTSTLQIHHFFTVGSLAGAFMAIKAIELTDENNAFNMPHITGTQLRQYVVFFILSVRRVNHCAAGCWVPAYWRRLSVISYECFYHAGKFLNLFHPSDPAAFRLEPFLSKQLEHRPPAFMAHYRYVFVTHLDVGSASTATHQCTTCAQVWLAEHDRAEEAPCVAHRQEEPAMGKKRAVWGQQVKGFQGPGCYYCQ